MKTIIFLPLLLIFFSAISQATCHDQLKAIDTESLSPKELVQSTTDLLIEDIKQNKAQYQEEPRCFHQVIDTLLGPTIDFDTFSARIMGKHYKKASTEQHQRFIETMKTNALRTYANTLLEFEGYSATVSKEEISEDKKRNTQKAKVTMAITTADGKSYPINYSMSQTEQKKWLIQNVVVNGINLGLTLRNHFSPAMQNYNNIDHVINTWDSDLSGNE